MFKMAEQQDQQKVDDASQSSSEKSKPDKSASSGQKSGLKIKLPKLREKKRRRRYLDVHQTLKTVRPRTGAETPAIPARCKR